MNLDVVLRNMQARVVVVLRGGLPARLGGDWLSGKAPPDSRLLFDFSGVGCQRDDPRLSTKVPVMFGWFFAYFSPCALVFVFQ